ncbi:MAG: malto-oligosyltrehalose synthase, partial [Micromonosporaceae bacterium]
RYHEHRFPLADGTSHGSPRDVHARQHYRLVSWRRADTDLNYRRFFAVNELAGLRVEDPGVFDAVHREVLRWYDAGDVDGIRVDHPDGLRDPAGYFERLRDAAPGAWLVAEKILETGERLPDWPIDGSTGYDALREVCGVFLDQAGEPAFTALDEELTGAATGSAPGGSPAAGCGSTAPAGTGAAWPELAYRCRREVATTMLRTEVRRLSRLAPGIPDVAEAIAEVLAAMPVYRSYLPDGAEHLTAALSAAAVRRPDLDPAVTALGTRLADPGDELAVRFQQTSGAVMAKGVEDGAFYRYARFVALNEVGGDPGRFGVSVTEFHDACAERQRRHPYGMTTLSTHDTKRGEDVRARMAVLSELPSRWAAAVRRWLDRVPMPDPGFGHLLWQTLIGAWPIERDRLDAYARKAAREARVWTTWEDPDTAAEDAMAAGIDRIYDDPDLRREVDAFAAGITPAGWSNALGQKLVQLTMPGVPDTYQGTEVWDNSLVDPDNRREVDVAARRALLRKLDAGWLPPVDASGAAKLLVTSRALRLRRDESERFTGCAALTADGPASEHVVGFDRGGVLTVVTRLPVGLRRRPGGWGETVLPLPDGVWTDVLTGGEFRGDARLADLLNRYPVALLRADTG